eukprot:3149328-Prorocentrum_lima.AAC.1
MSPLFAAPTPSTLPAFSCLHLPLLPKAFLLLAFRRVVGVIRGALLFLRFRLPRRFRQWLLGFSVVGA